MGKTCSPAYSPSVVHDCIKRNGLPIRKRIGSPENEGLNAKVLKRAQYLSPKCLLADTAEPPIVVPAAVEAVHAHAALAVPAIEAREAPVAVGILPVSAI